MRSLEKLFKQNKSDWSIHYLRELWDHLNVGLTRLDRSVEHESTWLFLSGYCLRPGFGYPGDEERINEAWRIFDLGLRNKKDLRIRIQWHIFWRRISGGLNKERQEKLFDLLIRDISKDEGLKKEAFRTLSCLELVSLERKQIIADMLLAKINPLKLEEAFLWSFAKICSRQPKEALDDKPVIVPAQTVKVFFEKFATYDWSDKKFLPVAKAMLFAGRISRFDEFNIEYSLRGQIVEKLIQANYNEEYLKIFYEYIPINSNEGLENYGESLPAGLTV